MLQSYLYLDKTAHAGRGVFTNEDIAAGTVIEISPVIIMHKDDRMHLDKTLLHDEPANQDRCAIGVVGDFSGRFAWKFGHPRSIDGAG